ncbi:MAG: zinc ribbon domain-containing protein [Candidatus Heimdallarchaeota archaeon]|nr:zinc ribbon domain-containing protein [Candidatus Heimdallarchaeota archaeon]
MSTEDYDYRLDGSNAERIDEIAPTKILVAKTDVSETEAEAIFNREKLEVFKGLFKRPKDNEVVVTSVKKSFEPYMILGGEYELRYLTERTYDLDLDDNTVSVFVLGEELIVPEQIEEEVEVEIKGKKKGGFFDGLFSKSNKEPLSKAELQITGIEHVHIKKDIVEARNYKGTSINPESLDEAELLEVSDEFLLTEASILPKDYFDIDTLTNEIINEYTEKPEGVQRILFEKLILADKKIIFYPVFWAVMIYKDSKEKNVRLDCITHKVMEEKGTRFAPPPSSSGQIQTKVEVAEGKCPECQNPIEADDVFCETCGVKLK